MNQARFALLVASLLLPASACDSEKTDEPQAEAAKPEAKANDTKPADAKPEGVDAKDDADQAPADAAAPAVKKLNLNTATKEEFKSVPNVGDKMAHEFDEYRPYVSIAQFRKEIGKYVDEKAVAEFEKYVFVPIAYNDCDADTLAQVPGVDAKVAEGLIAGRPYADEAAFLSKVSELGGDDAKAAAADMLAKGK